MPVPPQRQRGGLIPIGDALSGLPGPVQALRETSPQALRHFTRNPSIERLPVAQHGIAVPDPTHSVLRNISPTSVWRSSKRSIVPSENTSHPQSVFFALSNEQPIPVLIPPSREIDEYGFSRFSSYSISIPLPAIPFPLLLLLKENAVTFAEPESSLDDMVQSTRHKLRQP